MGQNDFIERKFREEGRGAVYFEHKRKRESREVKKVAKRARRLKGIKAKLFNKQRYREKVNLKKTIKAHEEKSVRAVGRPANEAPVPAYLIDREHNTSQKVLSNMVKQKRREKAGRWAVPVAKVRALNEAEMFQVLKSGKRKQKSWKRVINKLTFVPENFVRKPPKYERFIRPAALRFRKVNVTHPELKTTFYLDIVGVKRNPQSALYTSLGVLTKGTILEVNVAELGLVTQNGKVVVSKYAQITNSPENDGCINALLLV